MQCTIMIASYGYVRIEVCSYMIMINVRTNQADLPRSYVVNK